MSSPAYNKKWENFKQYQNLLQNFYEVLNLCEDHTNDSDRAKSVDQIIGIIGYVSRNDRFDDYVKLLDKINCRKRNPKETRP